MTQHEYTYASGGLSLTSPVIEPYERPAYSEKDFVLIASALVEKSCLSRCCSSANTYSVHRGAGEAQGGANVKCGNCGFLASYGHADLVGFGEISFPKDARNEETASLAKILSGLANIWGNTK